jgi:hypothetical protein
VSDQALTAMLERVRVAAAGGQLYPSDLAEIGNFALDRLEASEPETVLRLLEPLRERAQNVPRLWQALALAYRATQQTEAGLDAARRAAALDPANAAMANTHAVLAFEAGQASSSSLFKTARSISPGDSELALSAAAALAAEGKASAAESVLSKLIADQPDHVRAHNALSTLRWMRQGENHFDASYVSASLLRSTSLELRLAWYRAAVQINLFDKARAIVADGRTIFGDLPEFDAAEAYIASESGDYARADRLFARLQSAHGPVPTTPIIRNYLRVGKLDEAETAALALLETSEAAFAWPYLSLIWRLKNDPRAQWLDGEPPFFRVTDLDYSADELAALANLLRRLHVSQFHPPEQSMRGGTQTEGNLLLRIDPEIQLLRERLLGAIRDYVDALPPHDPTHPLLGAPRNQLLFVGSWSVRLTQQGFHVCHTHQQGWISSAFYVSLPAADEMGPAPAGWLELGAPPPDLRVDLPAYARVEPKPGRLVLFPSTMWHGTVPFNDGERLTVAFDVARTLR